MGKYQKPVWLSEFSCAHMQADGALTPGTAEENLKLAMELLPALESREHVAKYFWCATTVEQAMQFPFLVNSHLIEGKGEEPIKLTEVGKYFVDFSYKPPSPTPPAPPSPAQASQKK